MRQPLYKENLISSHFTIQLLNNKGNQFNNFYCVGQITALKPCPGIKWILIMFEWLKNKESSHLETI